MTGVSWGRAKAAFAMMAMAAGAIAYACSDGGSGPGSFDAADSTAILSPANDTRTNLLLLLADRHGTAVASPESMATGIVPIVFRWGVLTERLSPPAQSGEASPAEWEEAEGSRCNSNQSGAAEFIAAVRSTADVPQAEKQLLITARQALRPSCGAPDASPYRPAGFSTPSARDFSTYLVGADEFYRGQYESARSRFAALSRASTPWVRETALYMVARNELNRAQAVSLDEYGSLAPPDKRDRHTIALAEAAFDAYLKAFPNGRYASSAKGLLRRVAWLKGDQEALGAAYSALVGSTLARDGSDPNLGLIQEIDIKLLPDGEGPGVTDPTLLAVVDLMRLRQHDPEMPEYEGDYRGPKLERAELERQRPHFRSDPPLFEYLLAVEAFYGRKMPAEVLQLIPDAAHQKRFSYVQFSRQMLRGFALEAMDDPNARGFWLSLLPGANQPYQREAVELALANHDRKSRRVDALFAAGSPLRHPLIRQHLLEESAGPALLRRQTTGAPTQHEREVSLYLLLAGELHHGLYADFLRDLAKVGPRKSPEEGAYFGGWDVASYDPDYGDELGPPPLEVFAAGGSDDLDPCPDIRTTAASLATSPAAIRPRLCLAEFIRRKGFDGWNQTYDAQYNLVPRARNGFPGQPVERIDIYRAVIANPSATADDKAFALNRAIRCYEPSGYNGCGGKEVPLETRKAWFRQLKVGRLAGNRWAKDLKYYW